MDVIAFTYDASANPHEAALPGVPLRDLTVADLSFLSLHQLGGVRACGFYVATKDAPKAPTKPTQPAEQDGEKAAPPAAVVVARAKPTGPSETKD